MSDAIIERMYMVQTRYLAPFYGISRTRQGLLKQLRERNIDWRIGKKRGWKVIPVEVRVQQ